MTARAARVDDDSARRLAQTEFEHPLAVEAGAGTGKTTVLVARILSWCLGQGWLPARDRLWASGAEDVTDDDIAAEILDGVLAITFTEAAAAQMARRVAEGLTELGRDPAAPIVGFYKELLPVTDPEVLRGRARALTGALDHLAVRTIHSHCWHLLASYPMALGLSPDLEVDAESRQLAELVRELVEQATKNAYESGPQEALTRLAIRGIDPRRVATAVVDLVGEGLPADALAEDPLGQVQRGAIISGLREIVGRLAPLTDGLTEQRGAAKDQATAITVTESRDLLEEVDTADRDALIRILARLREIWDEGRLGRLGDWSRGRFTKSLIKTLGDETAQLARDSASLSQKLRLYRRMDVEILDAGREALRPLLADVEKGLRARGLVTYSSLMTEAWKLLREQVPVLRSERRGLQQLLVDEFQDTDRLQCDLVRSLALGGEPEDRPGLFVVGDPKQSIYGWRDADLEAYEHFLEDLRAARGVSVVLDRNFRSVSAVLDEVERSIAPVMQAEPGLQPEFAGLRARQELSDDSGFRLAGRRPVEYWVAWGAEGPRTKADDAARLEATAIAVDIAALHHDQGVPWSDFGLLLRSTSRLEVYLEQFRHHQVPFAVTSDKQYFRRREVIEAAALVRTILVPVDHLALVTFLRSATVGVPDAALLPLWRRRFPELITRLQRPDSPVLDELREIVEAAARELPSDIPGLGEIHGWPSSTIAALENLADLRATYEIAPADRFVDRLRRRFLFDATEAARHLGAYRLANLDRFFREFETALESQHGDLQAVLRALRRGVTEAEEAQQALPEGATETAVQVMTIHGAKGLEFAHVYLPQLHTEGRSNHTPDIQIDRQWQPGREARYVLFGSPTPGFDRVEDHRAQVERVEQIRTLYVAMTRARERLVLIGNWPAEPAPVAAGKRKTYLDLLRSREGLPESLTALRTRCEESGATYADEGEVRWRFLDLEDLAAQASVRRPQRAALPTIKNVKHQAARLGRRRQTANERMSRPMSGSASAEAADRLARLGEDETALIDSAGDRDLALAVGSAFHRLMESWQLVADPVAELARQREIQCRWLEASLPSARITPARERFEQLVDRFSNGRFMERFSTLAELPLAREVPILTAPDDPDSGPVGFVSGFVDLIYRESESGRWVIVDYKTDRVEGEAELGERATAYALQEAVYAQALQRSLSLTDPPATELWFIWPDVLWQEEAAS